MLMGLSKGRTSCFACPYSAHEYALFLSYLKNIQKAMRLGKAAISRKKNETWQRGLRRRSKQKALPGTPAGHKGGEVKTA